MCAQSRRELLLALRPQYLNAPLGEKKKLLDGLVRATGYDRKYAVTLLSRGSSEKRQGTRKRKRKYDDAVVDALLVVWQAANRICSKRLVPFMPSLVEALTRFGHLNISQEVKKQLLSVSPATADRLLKHEKKKYGRGKSTTTAGYLIKKHIPIRTFADWNDVVPGFLEADLVAHCGENVRGPYLNTLTVTDIATGWTELGALMGKGEIDVLQEITEIKESLPFPLLGFDTDNGGEFINYGLVEWCSQNSITFTRSREYKKNDQATTESKNNHLVRKYGFYYRYDTDKERAVLNRLWRLVNARLNYLTPTIKPIGYGSGRDGQRRRLYDAPRTPLDRLLEAGVLSPAQESELRAYRDSLNPAAIARQIADLQTALLRLAKDKTEQLYLATIPTALPDVRSGIRTKNKAAS